MNLRRILVPALLALTVAVASAQKAGATISISGFVKKDGMSGKMFVIGSNKGTYKVNATKATVRKDGKFFSMSKITPGSNVTAKGMLSGKDTIMATDVDVNYVKGDKKEEPKEMPKKKKGMGKMEKAEKAESMDHSGHADKAEHMDKKDSDKKPMKKKSSKKKDSEKKEVEKKTGH